MGILDFLGTTAMTNVANLGMSALQMHREDNAVQRRVRDLESAGLNPVLAAGSAATAQAPARMESANGAGPGTETATARSQAAMTQAQADYMDAQADEKRADARIRNIEADEKSYQAGAGKYSKIEYFDGNYLQQALRLEQDARNIAATTERNRQLFISKHQNELNEIYMREKKAGATEAEANAATKKWLAEVAQKEAAWFEARALFGMASNLTGQMAGWNRINPR